MGLRVDWREAGLIAGVSIQEPREKSRQEMITA